MISLTKHCDTIAVHQTSDIVLARSLARSLSASLGFGKADQTRLATAVSELTRNVIMHAGSGECRISDVSDADFKRIEIVVEDQGPGIASIESAMQDGFSTSGSMGAGLSGTRRLVETFNIVSEPGLTCVTIALSLRRN